MFFHVYLNTLQKRDVVFITQGYQDKGLPLQKDLFCART